MTTTANWVKYMGLPSSELIVLVHVDMLGPVRALEVVKACSRSKELCQATVYNILKRLVDAGFVALHDHQYELTPEGRAIRKHAAKVFKDFGKTNGLLS